MQNPPEVGFAQPILFQRIQKRIQGGGIAVADGDGDTPRRIANWRYVVAIDVPHPNRLVVAAADDHDGKVGRRRRALRSRPTQFRGHFRDREQVPASAWRGKQDAGAAPAVEPFAVYGGQLRGHFGVRERV